MTIFKPGQGYYSRTGAAVLFFLLGIFAGWSWYGYCQTHKNTSTFFTQETGAVGGIVIPLALIALGCWIAFLNEGTADYLIDMDIELRKVVWPKALPAFDPKVEAWGSTYVVIVLTVMLTVYIGLVDAFLEFTMAKHLLVWLLT